MNTCGGNRAEVLAEDYLRGTLPEAESQSFEEHYLVCNACFEHVRALQAAGLVLKKEPAELPVRRTSAPPTWAAFAAIAAAIFLAAVIFNWSGRDGQPAQQTAGVQTPTQAPVEQKPAAVPPAQNSNAETSKPTESVELASLADQTLPPFHDTELRGASEDEYFEAGMQAYVANDCKGALEDLKRVPRESARADAAALYLGACNYKLRHFDAARASLSGLANDERSPLSESARYYLAQLELSQHNTAAAQRWLNEVLALRGDYEARARAQLRKIGSVASR